MQIAYLSLGVGRRRRGQPEARARRAKKSHSKVTQIGVCVVSVRRGAARREAARCAAEETLRSQRAATELALCEEQHRQAVADALETERLAPKVLVAPLPLAPRARPS